MILDPHRKKIGEWLNAGPALTAVGVLTRLKARYPDRFTDNLRTRHRVVRARRAGQAKHVIRRGIAALEAAMATVIPLPSDGPARGSFRA